jgi:hypothetical protein
LFILQRLEGCPTEIIVRHIIPPLRPVRIGHKTDSDSYKKTVFTTVFAMPGDAVTCNKCRDFPLSNPLKNSGIATFHQPASPSISILNWRAVPTAWPCQWLFM